MTREEMRALQPGHMIRGVSTRVAYIVTANYGDRITAVQTVDVTNPSEWLLVGMGEPERPAAPAGSAWDALAALWNEGRRIVDDLTKHGTYPTEIMIGRWLNQANSDAALVLDVLRRAEKVPPNDISAWVRGQIEAAMAQRA